eukprot:TRINITY_DN12354_c0_g1_i3.p3 TRINITY_DN12354_c0_g1~~TRINITY_DN12354_c0_g1_i3.p3  ORF type:complete len:135 (+),score=29.33 TRINITY_DN12354_c0_g1_i3:1471-1875(+)
MFFSLINNYLICYKQSACESPFIAKDVFDFDKYLDFFDAQSYPFMSELCKTQGFCRFVEKSYRAREEKNETYFFEQGVRLCSAKGEKELAFMVKRIKDQLLRNNRNVHVAVTLEYSHYLFLWMTASTYTRPNSL